MPAASRFSVLYSMLPAQFLSLSLEAQARSGETTGPAVKAETALRNVRLSMMILRGHESGCCPANREDDTSFRHGIDMGIEKRVNAETEVCGHEKSCAGSWDQPGWIYCATGRVGGFFVHAEGLFDGGIF